MPQIQTESKAWLLILFKIVLHKIMKQYLRTKLVLANTTCRYLTYHSKLCRSHYLQ